MRRIHTGTQTTLEHRAYQATATAAKTLTTGFVTAAVVAVHRPGTYLVHGTMDVTYGTAALTARAIGRLVVGATTSEASHITALCKSANERITAHQSWLIQVNGTAALELKVNKTVASGTITTATTHTRLTAVYLSPRRSAL